MVEGQTIAVDPRVIPYGTKVIIGGHIFTAEDCGGAIQGNHIDIYVNNPYLSSVFYECNIILKDSFSNFQI